MVVGRKGTQVTQGPRETLGGLAGLEIQEIQELRAQWEKRAIRVPWGVRGIEVSQG